MQSWRPILAIISILIVVVSWCDALADDPKPQTEPTAFKVTEVPNDLRESLKLDPFYKKYTSASGLPVLSSDKVSDKGVQEAAYLINRMLAEREDVLKAMIKNRVRFVV